MDESWRAPIGSVVPRRRSAEQMRRTGGSLGAADFRDVFGGPPRSVLLRQFSCVEPSSACSSASPFPLPREGNECWLRPPRGGPAQDGGKEERKPPPDFSLPAGAAVGRWVVGRDGGFCDGTFESGGGDGEGGRSRTRSWKSKTRSTSSSVVNSEDGGGDFLIRPAKPFVDDDSVLSSFASKLRPIIVPSRRRPGGSPSQTVTSTGEQSSSWKHSTAPSARPYFLESRFDLDGIPTRAKVDGDPYNRPLRRHSPPPSAAAAARPETGQPVAGEEDDESGSGSSIYDDIPMATIVAVGAHERAALLELEKEVRVVLEEEEEIEAEGYGTIEIVPGGKAAVDAEGAGAVDEAIAWAKEKFRAAASSSSPEVTSVGDDELEREEQRHVKKVVDGLLSGRDAGGGGFLSLSEEPPPLAPVSGPPEVLFLFDRLRFGSPVDRVHLGGICASTRRRVRWRSLSSSTFLSTKRTRSWPLRLFVPYGGGLRGSLSLARPAGVSAAVR